MIFLHSVEALYSFTAQYFPTELLQEVFHFFKPYTTVVSNISSWYDSKYTCFEHKKTHEQYQVVVLKTYDHLTSGS
jgi:hypothetical protein